MNERPDENDPTLTRRQAAGRARWARTTPEQRRAATAKARAAMEARAVLVRKLLAQQGEQ